MPTLSVNIDHIATLREARRGTQPDPVTAALLAELAGAHGITCHLREDRRHIQDRDLKLLLETVRTRINLEMAPTPGMVDLACASKPYLVTLVPEKRQELTTEGGLDVKGNQKHLEEAIRRLHQAHILVSVFIEADIQQVKAAVKIHADSIELHTGTYANASHQAQGEELEKLADLALLGSRLGIVVNAGHGLDYRNVAYVAAIENLTELNIGHSIISRAVMVGMDRAVRDMLALIN
jgi:pyridoxine 5-phosphate synthase